MTAPDLKPVKPSARNKEALNADNSFLPVQEAVRHTKSKFYQQKKSLDCAIAASAQL